MARIWHYQCKRCRTDQLAGSRCWECAHCGGDLIVIHVIDVDDPIEDKQIEEAMINIMEGFEGLLGDDKSD